MGALGWSWSSRVVVGEVLVVGATRPSSSGRGNSEGGAPERSGE